MIFKDMNGFDMGFGMSSFEDISRRFPGLERGVLV